MIATPTKRSRRVLYHLCGLDRTEFWYDSHNDGTHLQNRGRTLPPARVPIDAHVHVESSHLTPARFGRLIAAQGTLTAICDPHEIVNVMCETGLPGGRSEALSRYAAADVAADIAALNAAARQTGCTLSDPFATLSFLALPVIPALKLTDCGLFDI